jgi:hypothetical protein
LDLRETAEMELAFGKAVKQRFQSDAPDLRAIGRALAEIQQLVELIRSVKQRGAPAPGEAQDSETNQRELTRDSTRLRAPSDVPGPSIAALCLGRALIDFDDRARALAEATTNLKKNREEYDSLKKKMIELDAQYEEIIARISREKDYQALLGQSVKGTLAGSAGEGPALPSSE